MNLPAHTITRSPPSMNLPAYGTTSSDPSIASLLKTQHTQVTICSITAWHNLSATRQNLHRSPSGTSPIVRRQAHEHNPYFTAIAWHVTSCRQVLASRSPTVASLSPGRSHLAATLLPSAINCRNLPTAPIAWRTHPSRQTPYQ